MTHVKHRRGEWPSYPPDGTIGWDTTIANDGDFWRTEVRFDGHLLWSWDGYSSPDEARDGAAKWALSVPGQFRLREAWSKWAADFSSILEMMGPSIINAT